MKLIQGEKESLVHVMEKEAGFIQDAVSFAGAVALHSGKGSCFNLEL